jgi:hypothetical protein
MFVIVSLQWTVVNPDEIFIIVILLLWTLIMLQCCDFIVFVG